MLSGTQGASLLGNLLSGKEIVKASYGNKKGNRAIARMEWLWKWNWFLIFNIIL